MSGLIPDLKRVDAKSVTTFKRDGGRGFAYAYPAKRKGSLQVYFLGHLDAMPEEVPGMPSIIRRKSVGSAWAQNTPFFVFAQTLSQVDSLARFLASYPLSIADGARTRPLRARIRSELVIAEEVPEGTYEEGQIARVSVNRYERDSRARKACIEHFGAICACCGTNLETIYGPIARGFIHVHHINPLSRANGPGSVDPTRDLIPVCPNCHAIIHIPVEHLTLDEVRDLIRMFRSA